ncbi:PadR family transcriptional regulator [Corynebacterium pseudopelargi]|uniref:Transcriptional regulator PadR-like family protein n=1 Tax=Corynebacterium pseudopelargi TaxID=2080757 RepID=A0A3G6IYE3_9CORY|nr:PadR family transcriptional regulator [Corynebacterium pseudopelargi]AZA09688.1 Transcriptional regulator PadR-like family protein [Corynebacterium pseudopelargi]
MAIKHALMALLHSQELSANQLRQHFQEATDEMWPLNIGQVTQTLDRLVRDGLVAEAGTAQGSNGRTVQVYRLSEAGKEALQLWWRTPALRTEDDRDELVTKIVLAANNGVDLLALIDRQRAGVLQKLRALHKQNQDLPEDRSAEKLLYERRIFDLEAEARWLDRVEALAPKTKGAAS